MPMNAEDLRGVFPALVTPFDSAGRFDEAGMSALIVRMFDAGIAGIVPLGGTGEFTALSMSERKAVIEASVAAAHGRGPVIAGVLSPGFEEAAEAGAAFVAAGADALMVVTPFYVLSSQQGILDYYRKMHDTVGVPFVLYEIPEPHQCQLRAGNRREAGGRRHRHRHQVFESRRGEVHPGDVGRG